MDNILNYFGSPIYSAVHPEYIDLLSSVTDETLAKLPQKVHEIFPMHQTENFANDPRVDKFCTFVGNQGWYFLRHQGYAMDRFGVTIDSVWAQIHYKHSLMEQHVHGGAHLVGFYFLETPDGSSRAMFHDPRPGKMQTFLPEVDPSAATIASNIINFTPEPGMLILSNSWLPHSFGRHASDLPLKFVHFNLGVILRPDDVSISREVCRAPVAEVI